MDVSAPIKGCSVGIEMSHRCLELFAEDTLLPFLRHTHSPTATTKNLLQVTLKCKLLMVLLCVGVHTHMHAIDA